ncbi:translation elongation factor 2 (EF-2/EF-G) [Frankia casuarinae]|uniref:Translation elongation factor 2 (EF-2/EF-G) n=3 Tax=Frankia casuarinae (strain DSM 45818 / CECT 9043 / HFP020203 / CcI3) TaxID=106370 RepID=Q2JDA4_FRACC|nr:MULTISPECIES: elongation factor G-like protein EF-G2 [Frankia]ABD10738.1 translation elongation factor 2 (EF-2/EF-G) [Frankia casuarinae]ETA02085.1 translation elongation factor 2 (EF-2/EF-G) [Frankia sp. CcI6]EYT93292.1 translation elongation factor 2 (EF-2/EF-G) [Frankia casuarinae]KEZ37699.1 translation elongation factor 2 (EF-2/EF-G) [Frankia sp. CeD]TFE34792.1 elongation factor G-like protein EF-G2 [Frankia sp. B2]
MSSASCDVRNVVLVGHTGAGKTALVDRLLATAGPPDRQNGDRQTAQTSYVGHADPERRPARSVSLTLCSVSHRGLTINLLDTPGYPDFVGELRAGLRAADAALFVVSAIDGVDGATGMVWAECAGVGMPRAIVLTHLDHPRADFAAAVEGCQRAFGAGVLPAYLPEREAGASMRLVDLLSGRVREYPDGGCRELATPADLTGRYASARAALVEGIIAESEDEALLDRYLSGDEPDTKLLLGDLETAVARGTFFPVLPAGLLPGSTSGPGAGAGSDRGVDRAGGFGSVELLDLFVQGFPSPREHLLPPVSRPDGSPCEQSHGDPAGPLVAEVVKTTTDPYVGRMSVIRVFSGTLHPDDAVHVSGHGRATARHADHDDDEQVGALSRPYGSVLHTVGECPAGGICVVTKLSTAETGDTLSDRDDPRYLPAWSMPEPQLPVAISARSRADEDRLSTALGRLAVEDPTLRIEQNPETAQLVLWCMGEAHSDAVLERLAQRYGAAVDRIAPRIPLRETLRAPARGLGRQVKQSGGHGQFAVCQIEVEPLPAGGGFEFVDEVVGGAVPRAFIPSVEKGVRAQMAQGVRTGHPMVDLRVRLVDGKAHSVDSSDMAFQIAGALALKDAARAAGVVVLEPILAVDVLVPDEYVGAVMGDLSTRRGRVVGMEPIPGRPRATPRAVIHAEVPASEMIRYAIELRSLSHGTGSFTRNHRGYEPMPPQLGDALSA